MISNISLPKAAKFQVSPARHLGDLREKQKVFFRFATVLSREIFFCGREIFVINNHFDTNGYKVNCFFFFLAFLFLS